MVSSHLYEKHSQALPDPAHTDSVLPPDQGFSPLGDFETGSYLNGLSHAHCHMSPRDRISLTATSSSQWYGVRKLTPRESVTQPQGHHVCTLLRTHLSQAPSPPQAGSDHGRSRNLSHCSFISRGTSTVEGHRAQRGQSICPRSTWQITMVQQLAGRLAERHCLIKKTIDSFRRETNRVICLPTTS